MGKSKEIRKRTLLERLAAEKAGAVERERVLSGAVTKLRGALVEYAKGENWAQRFGGYSWFSKKKPSPLIWVGDGNPEDLAKAAIAAVFGKDHPLTGEVVPLQGQGEPLREGEISLSTVRRKGA